MANNKDDRMSVNMYCSFCGRNQVEAKKLISSPDGSCFICEDCVTICKEMLSEEKKKVNLTKLIFQLLKKLRKNLMNI